MSIEEPEHATPAERGLERHVPLLREDPPQPVEPLAPSVARTARWQRAVRSPLRTVGTLAAALAEGVNLIVGGRRGEERK